MHLNLFLLLFEFYNVSQVRWLKENMRNPNFKSIIIKIISISALKTVSFKYIISLVKSYDIQIDSNEKLFKLLL